MKVSVITVCYNSEATLEATIQSVLAQDYRDVEYIIVDGKSADGTSVILERYKDKISKFISEEDEGMYFAINKGISLATGEVISILNSDDVFAHGTVLSEIIQELKRTGADAVYGDLQYVSRQSPDKVIRHWKSKPFSSKLFFQGWMPPHPTFFVKSKCYANYGKFNTSFKISADYELMLRFLVKCKISVSYIPKVLVRMKTGGISNVSLLSRVKANLEDRRAWKINELRPGSLTLLFKPLSKLSQFFR